MKYISLRMVAALVVFALCAPLFSQDASQNQGAAVTAASDITLSTDESTIVFDTTAPAAVPNAADSPSALWLFVRAVLVLFVVVALIYGALFLLKRARQPSAENDPFLRKVSQVTLSPGKSVQIVTLFNHAYLIGVTDNAVNLIGEITDQELVDSMNLYADQNAGETRPRTFSDILNIFMPNGPRAEQTGTAETSAQTATENLQRQRERLRGEEEQSQ